MGHFVNSWQEMALSWQQQDVTAVLEPAKITRFSDAVAVIQLLL